MDLSTLLLVYPKNVRITIYYRQGKKSASKIVYTGKVKNYHKMPGFEKYLPKIVESVCWQWHDDYDVDIIDNDHDD